MTRTNTKALERESERERVYTHILLTISARQKRTTPKKLIFSISEFYKHKIIQMKIEIKFDFKCRGDCGCLQLVAAAGDESCHYNHHLNHRAPPPTPDRLSLSTEKKAVLFWKRRLESCSIKRLCSLFRNQLLFFAG